MADNSEVPPSEIPAPGVPAGGKPADPYPRMILVCFGIFMVLIVIIFGVIALDMSQRVDRRVVQPGFDQSEPAPPPLPAE